MILDEALRDPEMEYFMGERTKTNETGNTRSLIHYVNQRLKAVNREFKCSKRMLQNDVAYFVQKGAKLEPRFRRGHKRILRYINLDWKNPLLKAASFLRYEASPVEMPALPDGPMTPVTLRITASEETVRAKLGNPEVLQRSTDSKTKSVTLQVEVPLSKELENLLLSMGTDIEVLAPENLRDDLRQTIAALQKIYKKETASARKTVQGDLFEGLF